MKEVSESTEFWVNVGIIIGYILMAVAVIGVVVLPLLTSIMNGDIKSLIKVAIGVGIILVIFLISWAISGNEATEHYAKYGVGESSSKVIGGSIIMMYIFLVASALAVFYGEVSKFFR